MTLEFQVPYSDTVNFTLFILMSAGAGEREDNEKVPGSNYHVGTSPE